MVADTRKLTEFAENKQYINYHEDIADIRNYLSDIVNNLNTHWPDNQRVNIVCHGHSVPSGYFATPMVDTFNAYPHLLHKKLKSRFPFAVINVIVTAIGGENSKSGSERFEEEVLCHRPDVITIDYGLNDRRLKLEEAKKCWCFMIEKALAQDVKVILLTPTMDTSGVRDEKSEDWLKLKQNVQQIRDLAQEYKVGLVDSFAEFEKYVESSGNLTDLLAWSNHPNRQGHEIVANCLLRWFPIL